MLDVKEIQKIIPHRYPFLLVDKIIELEEGKKAVGIKNVSANESYFAGHFPKHPVMPGVLIIEALAQVGAIIALKMPQYADKIAFFAGIDKVRFRKQVVPGDTLRLEVELTKIRGPVGKGEGKAFVGDDLVAEGELTFMIGSSE
jgi:3-hydroxyacyl-[acyl-carrier-protein] dehydratase